MLYGRLVLVGVTNRFTDLGLCIAQKCVWQPGSARTRWGAIPLPKPPSRYKGRGGREGKERVGNSSREGKEDEDVNG